MSPYRKSVFANNEYYHLFNRGLDKRPTFTDRREFNRAVLTLDYYRFRNPPLKLSKAIQLNLNERLSYFEKLRINGQKMIEIIAYCLMPNHFHLLVKQNLENGVSSFISCFTNSYTRYFNTRKKRRGSLFQGVFKSVHIEDNEQLLHVQRYIHINPAVSFITNLEKLQQYEWSSMCEYFGLDNKNLCNKDIVLNQFSTTDKFKKFLFDQVDYGRSLKQIEHLLLE